MTDALQVVGPRNGTAPLVYTVSDLGAVDLQSVFAHFDGTGASGDWRPVVTVKAQNGTILSRTGPEVTLAIGDTADVTYAPFLRTGGGAASSLGVQFDTFPQAGTYLFLTTTGVDPLGQGLDMRSDNDVLIKSENGQVRITADDDMTLSGAIASLLATVGNLNLVSDNGTVFLNGDVVDMDQLTNGGTFSMHARGRMTLEADNGGMEISMFDPASDLVVNTSGALIVNDDNGNPIFKIDQDGDLHGLTGKALTFDL